MRTIEFPREMEYPPYAEVYMDLIQKDGTLLGQLQNNLKMSIEFISQLSPKQLLIKPSPDRWSIKEILVHIIDDERIYAYRALSFARNDMTSLPGFEIEDYTSYSAANSRSLESICEEYSAVRYATIAMYKGFSEEALLRIGEANGNRTSVRALGYHIAGHELFHIHTIKHEYLQL